MRKLKKKEEGGPGPKKPIVVTNPKDSRLLRYQDSLALYNSVQKLRDFEKANPDINKVMNDKKLWEQYSDLWADNQPDIGIALARQFKMRATDREKYLANFKPSGYTKLWNGDVNGEINLFDKPQQPYRYEPQEVISPPQLSRVGNTAPLSNSINPIHAPASVSSVSAGQVTPFSFTGRDDNGQQTTRYFSDLDTWKAATDMIGYKQRETTNNDKEAHATGYQFKQGGMKRKDMGGPQLAQVTTGSQNIPDWASNVSQGFLLNSSNLPGGSQQSYTKQPMQAQSSTNTIGDPINWGHVLQSNLLLGLGQGLANASSNSQQNAVKRFNQQQFNPLNYLPYTANYSQQDRFGDQSQMQRGGLVKKEDGGYSLPEDMRKWILGDEETPPVVQEAEEQNPQVEDDAAQQAAQFNMFIQMFGWDQADAEQGPQGEMKKGGWIPKHMHKGRCTPLGKPGCPKGSPQYNLAKTFKKHHGFHKKALGGTVGEEMDVSPEQYAAMIQQGYTFE